MYDIPDDTFVDLENWNTLVLYHNTNLIYQKKTSSNGTNKYFFLLWTENEKV